MTVDLSDDAAPPRRNGELVFDAPWEARAFGLAVAAASAGGYAWDEFRARLVEEISMHEEPYYQSWLAALERLVVERGLLAPDEIAARVAELERLDTHDHH